MKERYERIRNLRAAWSLRKNSTESDIGIVTRELLKTSGAIDQVTSNLGSHENFIHRFQDFSFRYLVGMVELKNAMLEKMNLLQSKQMAEARKEKICEIIEDKLKLEIETTQSATDLRTVLELLVNSNNSSG